MNVDSITANRYTYGNYELANKKNLPVSEQNSNIKDDFLKRGEELANKYFKVTPQNTQKKRPCGKNPSGRAYICYSIGAAGALI